MLGRDLSINKQDRLVFDHYSTWETSNTSVGSSNSDQIAIPTEASGTYDCTVYWGDGNSDYITTWNDSAWTHTYAVSGEKQIRIEGTFEGFRFVNTGDKLKLLSIDSAGTKFRISPNGQQFYGCSNLTTVDNLNTSNATSTRQMFLNCSNFTQGTESFNTSNVTDMYQMFYGCTVFNQSVSNFDTSNVTNMFAMFYNCKAFNQSVSNFDISNVTNIGQMFFGCSAFNQSVSNFSTSNVTDMNRVFMNCANFNQSVSNFDTSNSIYMHYMFYGCTNFNQDISNFNIESVTNVTDMLFLANSWSTENYGLFLNEIANNQNVVDSLSFRCSSTYPASAAAAHADLIATDLWTITDLGAA